MNKNLELELEAALLDASKVATDMLGYYPRGFLDMLSDKGAKQTSEELILRPKITHGLTVLYEKGRLDLSIEAIVLENQYKELFQDKTLKVARKSLRKLGYDFVEYLPDAPVEDGWTNDELQAAIEAYFQMLTKEDKGEAYNKSDVIRQLQATALRNRTKSSIEYRFQNISAVLEGLCSSWIGGYKPMRNVGQQVVDRTIEIIFSSGYLDRDLYASTSSSEELDSRYSALFSKPLVGKPDGVKTPPKSTSTASTYERSPLVKAWVLQNAVGKCECCGDNAPFETVAGLPFLELHHVKHLSNGGSDRVENAVAVCPNCHRALHYSSESESLRDKLYSSVQRLEFE